jgi:hypothetical protein
MVSDEEQADQSRYARSTLKSAHSTHKAEIESVATEGGRQKAEPELDRLSNIVHRSYNLFGNVTWADSDSIRRLVIAEFLS